jgi:hypothetical protein
LLGLLAVVRVAVIRPAYCLIWLAETKAQTGIGCHVCVEQNISVIKIIYLLLTIIDYSENNVFCRKKEEEKKYTK